MNRLLAALLLLCPGVVPGCVPIPTPPVTQMTEQPSAEVSPLALGQYVAVVPTWSVGAAMQAGDDITAWMADCVAERLRDALPNNRVMTAEEIRDDLFPWFEPKRVPRTDEDVQALIHRPAVASKVGTLGLRYVIDVKGADERVGFDMIGAPVGAGGGRAKHRATAQIIDLRDGSLHAGGTAESVGINLYAYMVVGVALVAPTSFAACHELGDALAEHLRPRI